MAKLHGRFGLIYLGSATATAVAYTRSEDLNLATDFADASVQGDSFKSYLPGLSDFKLSLSKLFDSAYFQLYDAVVNVTVLKCYFYPDRNNTSNLYFYGQVYVGLDSLKSEIGSITEETWSVVPASSMTVVHA